jgi:cysteine synthase
MTIRLYDPTAEPRAFEATLAPRLTTLAGKRVGILDNGKANAGTLMLGVAKVLQERYGVTEIIKREKPVAGPPKPEVLDALAQCDFALVGSAD